MITKLLSKLSVLIGLTCFTSVGISSLALAANPDHYLIKNSLNETGTPPQSNGVSLDFLRNLGLFVPPLNRPKGRGIYPSWNKTMNVPIGGGANFKVDNHWVVDVYDNINGDVGQSWQSQHLGNGIYLVRLTSYNGGSLCLNAAYQASTNSYIPNTWECNGSDGDQKWGFIESINSNGSLSSFLIQRINGGGCLAYNRLVNSSRLILKPCSPNDTT
jgi:hypothetical protein